MKQTIDIAIPLWQVIIFFAIAMYALIANKIDIGYLKKEMKEVKEILYANLAPEVQNRIHIKAQNKNDDKNKVAYIAGIVFIFIGPLLFFIPMFFPIHQDYTFHWYVPLCISTFGLCILWYSERVARAAIGVGEKVVSKSVEK